MAVNVGDKAPDFTLPDTSNEKRSLREFKGKNLVLAFMPGAFTGVCTKEVCALQDRSSEFTALDAQVIGISVDPPFAQKAWAQQNNIEFPLLTDFNRDVVRQFGTEFPNLGGFEGYLSTRRAVYVIDKEGIIRWAWVADPPNEPPYDEIKAALQDL